MCVSVGAAGITEVRPAATEKTKRTDKISLTSHVCHSPPATAVCSSSCVHKELMIKNSRKFPPESTAGSGSKGVSENYWNREMASTLHILQESRQTEDSPLLEHQALLMETSLLSRTDLLRMLSELSDSEKFAVTASCSNWQSCKEQQQSNDTGNTQREHAHTEERLKHNKHTHRKLTKIPGSGLRQNSEFC